MIYHFYLTARAKVKKRGERGPPWRCGSARVHYTSPKTAKVPYTRPIIPASPRIPHKASSDVVNELVFCPLTTCKKTFANIITPIEIPIIPLTIVIFNNHPIQAI